MFFKKQEKETPLSQDQNALSSALGRGITPFPSAKDELFHQPISFNPLNFIKHRFSGKCFCNRIN